jgi:signal transduction histidine kinase
VTLRATLRRRWDIDADTQASLPFDRVVALVNLRRIEIACLLAIANDLIEIALGFHVSALVLAIPAAIIYAGLSRVILRVRSLRAQQATVILFVGLGLLDAVWAVSQISRNDHVSGGYLLHLLSITMLFVLRPRTLAILILASVGVYAITLLATPISAGATTIAIVNAGIVSAIALVAGWLIHSARRSDHEQKRIIRAQNALLTEQQHDREQLMAITAHDLRSPLYGLRNLLRLASRRSAADGAVQIDAMRDAIFSLDGMIALVTRLLDAHSAEHAPLVAPVTEDIRVHLLAAARRNAPAGADTAIAVDLPDRPLIATFDAGALGHILDNLLTNAVRHNPPGYPVHLRGMVGGAAPVVEIEDAGPGFDAAGRAAMFSKFHPREDGRSSGKTGSGMGLFIAASFAERMGARLAYRAAEPHGACFSLLLGSRYAASGVLDKSDT